MKKMKREKRREIEKIINENLQQAIYYEEIKSYFSYNINIMLNNFLDLLLENSNSRLVNTELLNISLKRNKIERAALQVIKEIIEEKIKELEKEKEDLEKRRLQAEILELRSQLFQYQ